MLYGQLELFLCVSCNHVMRMLLYGYQDDAGSFWSSGLSPDETSFPTCTRNTILRNSAEDLVTYIDIYIYISVEYIDSTHHYRFIHAISCYKL